MTAYKVSRAAQADMRAIWIFTRKQWGAPQADLYMRGIFDALSILATNPLLGIDRHQVKAGYRSHICGRHILWYKNVDGLVVLIRVLHSAMDVKRHL
jgi:toxin ParE1/3/4